MKKILFILIAFVAFSSCEEIKKVQEAQEKRDAQKEYDELFEKAKASQQRSDTLYLGFRFGMSPKEVKSHFKKLIKEKVVSVDYLDRYTTELTLKGGMKRNATFRTEYYKDKLCELTLVFDGPSEYVFAFSAFKDANEGKKWKWIITEWLENKSRYTMFNNNMVIEFTGLIDSYMSFIDASLVDSLEIQKELEEKEATGKFKL